MIVKTGEADRYISKPPKEMVAALIYGPDEGLVRERAEKLAKTVVDDLKDPFRVSDFEADVLEKDPARLFDEAASISMLGGRRVVRVRGAGNALAKLFERFLDEPAGDALIVIEGGDLAKGTGLRRIFEDADNASAIACYSDSAGGIANVIRETLKAEGLTIGAEALDDAVSRLGADRGVTRREIEKLALYAKGAKSVTLEDVRATLGDEADVRVEEAMDAAGEGALARLDLALERLWAADVSPVQVVRMAISHFQKLYLVAGEAERGGDMNGAIKKLRPPIHFSREQSFRAQAARWNAERAGEALDMLLEAEALCKTTAVPAEAALGRSLFNIAAMARSRR
ncbi:MAG TPA: DNA polymerase III subunit delta [Rhizomicrobium sp.]|jgi:DNA polymerase-3 subunit delta|nr:DNA polymerase III subunit delta [Rhizomicrobium sp.]